VFALSYAIRFSVITVPVIADIVDGSLIIAPYGLQLII
jgi:hypothetical protein